MDKLNPFSLEGQMQLAAMGIKAKPARVARRHADSLAKLADAERELVRVFNRWSKLRAAVMRYERLLDKELTEAGR